VVESAARLAESAGELDTLSIAVSNLGEGYLEAGALDRGRSYLERSLELAERVGELASMGYSLVMIGLVLYYLGEWDEAQACIDRSAEVIRSVGSSWYSAYPPLQIGRLQVAQGAWEEAAHSLEECLAIAEPIGDVQALQGAHRLLGELEVLKGHPETARARLEPLAHGEQLPDQIGLLATLAWAQLEVGAVDQANETVASALEAAEARHNKPNLCEALRIQAMVQTRKEDWGEAQGTFDQAVSLARSLPYPYAEARALHEYGVMRIRQGNLAGARERLDEALAIFLRLGARKETERVEAALMTVSLR
jgi:tetratricopeptide (TPR) repeat protein